jgi:predicted negative regulator of RcsB-dependent stress response
MSKNKIIAIVGSSAVLVVGLGIGGWWTWHNHQTTASFASTSMGQVSTGAEAKTVEVYGFRMAQVTQIWGNSIRMLL